MSERQRGGGMSERQRGGGMSERQRANHVAVPMSLMASPSASEVAA
jgi:hypothetical protein